MLYSTIEEAWSKSNHLESFTSSKPDSSACDHIISQLLKCDGCMDKVLSLSGRRFHGHEKMLSSVISGLRQKAVEGFRSAMDSKESIRLLLLIIATIVTFVLLVSC